MATLHECPEEEAEAKAITCEGNGIKDAKRLNELTKLCATKPKKGGASSSSSSASTKPAADTKTSAASTSSDMPEGKYKCRGVDAEGKVLAAVGSDKSSLECIGTLKEKVGETLCAGGKLGFTYQSYTSGHWTKGTATEARCKK
jgi:hypothetical protein